MQNCLSLKPAVAFECDPTGGAAMGPISSASIIMALLSSFEEKQVKALN